MNKTNLDKLYKTYIKDIQKWLPDGIVDINLEVLHELDLLHFHSKTSFDNTLTRYFQVSECEDRLTLVNEQFIIWIAPEKIGFTPVTYTFIALNKPDDIQLEVGFITRGVYNNSHLVLSILERYLLEIQNTEDLISHLSA